ncbi:hypothetical protein Scep_012696 [Stephania cephalantha]|uniref:Uncharacterized protein n=1 Tax=Stephania cephalantha TaxID=152367 RepID=A0AAP0JFL4_9MAGN
MSRDMSRDIPRVCVLTWDRGSGLWAAYGLNHLREDYKLLIFSIPESKRMTTSYCLNHNRIP